MSCNNESNHSVFFAIMNKKLLFIYNFYRPPEAYSEFLTDFSDFLSTTVLYFDEIISSENSSHSLSPDKMTSLLSLLEKTRWLHAETRSLKQVRKRMAPLQLKAVSEYLET